MIKQIDNFTITETSTRVVVDYTKNAKDWFDTFITMILGLFTSVSTYLFLQHGFKTANFILILAGIILTIAAIYLVVSGLSRFFQPTRNLLVINKETNTLVSRQTPFASKTFSLNEIQNLVVSGQNEKISVGDGQKMTRTYFTISAKLKGKSDERLFTINTNRFFRPSIQKLEIELYSKAKNLASEINRHLKSKHQ
ncbi:MAG: hypothetical protein REI64_06855 [Pedobacter sp.]|uniref:hypothetical protein n=1 Tax=Pedobacter sp. TaxID=1411316 RepID=UPI002808E4B3|nr:hypothetical protein [Pedobacter sp.]MDQ8004505.1 hypothetical protein [Pedobacter sp.]